MVEEQSEGKPQLNVHWRECTLLFCAGKGTQASGDDGTVLILFRFMKKSKLVSNNTAERYCLPSPSQQHQFSGNSLNS